MRYCHSTNIERGFRFKAMKMMSITIFFSPLQNSENKALRKAISGIIWEMETKYELQKKADSETGLL